MPGTEEAKKLPSAEGETGDEWIDYWMKGRALSKTIAEGDRI
jgi:hypothetical protein